MCPQQPDRPAAPRHPLPTRTFVALVLAGVVLRALALPLPGTGDVLIWKTWSYNAVTAGETTLYGVGHHPPEHRELAYHSIRFKVDYPPLVLYELGLAGRLYHALAGEMPDTPVFTAAVKLPSVVAEAGLAVLIYFSARRMVGRQGARLAALAWWLNPAALLNASTLGYLDPLFALPAVAAVIAAAAGSTWLAGGLLAVSVMTKAQGVLVAPVVAMAVIAGSGTGSRRTGLIALRLGETAAGALAAGLLIVAPYAMAGSLPNMAAALGTLAQHDMLSGYAANLWWIATWAMRARDSVADVGLWNAVTALPRILAISRVVELGYPNPRLVGLAMMATAWVWAGWRARRARDLSLLAGVGAFLVHAYFVLAAQVHENHLLLAVPLAVLAGAGRPGWGRVAFVLTAIQALNLNLFYGFSEGIQPNLAVPRSITVIDAAVLLAAANGAALLWHASVLARESGLSVCAGGTENSG